MVNECQFSQVAWQVGYNRIDEGHESTLRKSVAGSAGGGGRGTIFGCETNG
jgi:hypothetical protein